MSVVLEECPFGRPLSTASARIRRRTCALRSWRPTGAPPATTSRRLAERHQAARGRMLRGRPGRRYGLKGRRDMRVLVLGAGVVGTTAAWYLARAGHSVAVIDRREDAALETSFANGGQISVSHAEPWANPGAPATILKWLGREDAPLLFRLRADARQWTWGLRFLLECLPSRTLRQRARDPRARPVQPRGAAAAARRNAHRLRPADARHPAYLHRAGRVRPRRAACRVAARTRRGPGDEVGARMPRHRAGAGGVACIRSSAATTRPATNPATRASSPRRWRGAPWRSA